MIKAVLFDMDGLIFDTENLSNRVFKIIEPVIGLPVEDSMLARMKGINKDGCARIMREYWGQDADIDGIRAESARVREKLLKEEGVPEKPGIHELLDFLKQHGILIGLATSTASEKAEAMLRETGILEYFDRIVYGNEVPNGKPNPDIYEECARRLSVDPQDCLVLEDAYSGIEAGFRAGAKVIMIPDTLPPTEREKERTAAILGSLLEVPAWIMEHDQ